MVLQQQTEVKLWGEATPNKKVVINVGWDKKKKYVTQTDSLGKWKIIVSTPKAGGLMR
ncbi:sialic acid-specific acetylesterase II [Bacteroides reticulotermitis JCM 10512]|uniref:Sialic acid-specific acetylesterase II n=2 Tax=Bacteroides reticulotermitis TaxID=1133319 RepID=W4UL37_9BACE|nr:sialic acid-specific acetylesterase II [Bacteroides reticulotermitis JCM 10512]